jgi:hypothetical protein
MEDLIMKKLFVPVLIAALALSLLITACSSGSNNNAPASSSNNAPANNSDINNNSSSNITVPALNIQVGETFSAEINAVIDSAGAGEYMAGKHFGVGNEEDGWQLGIEWRSADNFFGNVPENWEDAAEEERNEYFNDYLITRNNLEPDHEIKEITARIFWPADGAHDESYTEKTGKMVQFQVDDTYFPARYHTNVVIDFYSYFMQSDDEGAFFIQFSNTAEDEDRFNKNQVIFESFLGSIELCRFYR